MSLLWIGFILLGGLLFYVWYRGNKKRQLQFIENYNFSAAISQKVLLRYPHLSGDQLSLVMSALRDYFFICHKANKRSVSMPSQVVDVAWHEFILFTRSYQLFCKKSLGRFLHHTPSEAIKSPNRVQEGIKLAWKLACVKSRINPVAATRLPLLFAIDSKLNIADGFKYSVNCKDKSSPLYGDGYCASDIGCSSGCAGDSGSGGLFDGFGGGDSSGDSGGCSSGCGGD